MHESMRVHRMVNNFIFLPLAVFATIRLKPFLRTGIHQVM
jgi:hypothetical protein